MSNKVELVVVGTDDWEALYENGVNTWEDHRLDVGDILEGLVGCEVVSYNSHYVEYEIIEEVYNCNFPMMLSDFKKEHLE